MRPVSSGAKTASAPSCSASHPRDVGQIGARAAVQAGQLGGKNTEQPLPHDQDRFAQFEANLAQALQRHAGDDGKGPVQGCDVVPDLDQAFGLHDGVRLVAAVVDDDPVARRQVLNAAAAGRDPPDGAVAHVGGKAGRGIGHGQQVGPFGPGAQDRIERLDQDLAVLRLLDRIRFQGCLADAGKDDPIAFHNAFLSVADGQNDLADVQALFQQGMRVLGLFDWQNAVDGRADLARLQLGPDT